MKNQTTPLAGLIASIKYLSLIDQMIQLNKLKVTKMKSRLEDKNHEELNTETGVTRWDHNIYWELT